MHQIQLAFEVLKVFILLWLVCMSLVYVYRSSKIFPLLSNIKHLQWKCLIQRECGKLNLQFKLLLSFFFLENWCKHTFLYKVKTFKRTQTCLIFLKRNLYCHIMHDTCLSSMQHFVAKLIHSNSLICRPSHQRICLVCG